MDMKICINLFQFQIDSLTISNVELVFNNIKSNFEGRL